MAAMPASIKLLATEHSMPVFVELLIVWEKNLYKCT